MDKILISACLAGVKCRYDGKSAPSNKALSILGQGRGVLICPEQLGGLPTPREPAQRLGKKVISRSGKDLTKNYLLGAKEALRIAKLAKCNLAILKSKSPMCGCGLIYDGTFSGRLKEGDGVFCQLLKREKISIINE